ncbi:MAG: hypothetical protein AAF846_01050 [Chloroflexota bacterium]
MVNFGPAIVGDDNTDGSGNPTGSYAIRTYNPKTKRVEIKVVERPTAPSPSRPKTGVSGKPALPPKTGSSGRPASQPTSRPRTRTGKSPHPTPSPVKKPKVKDYKFWYGLTGDEDLAREIDTRHRIEGIPYGKSSLAFASTHALFGWHGTVNGGDTWLSSGDLGDVMQDSELDEITDGVIWEENGFVATREGTVITITRESDGVEIATGIAGSATNVPMYMLNLDEPENIGQADIDAFYEYLAAEENIDNSHVVYNVHGNHTTDASAEATYLETATYLQSSGDSQAIVIGINWNTDSENDGLTSADDAEANVRAAALRIHGNNVNNSVAQDFAYLLNVVDRGVRTNNGTGEQTVVAHSLGTNLSLAAIDIAAQADSSFYLNRLLLIQGFADSENFNADSGFDDNPFTYDAIFDETIVGRSVITFNARENDASVSLSNSDTALVMGQSFGVVENEVELPDGYYSSLPSYDVIENPIGLNGLEGAENFDHISNYGLVGNGGSLGHYSPSLNNSTVQQAYQLLWSSPVAPTSVPGG